MLSIENIVLLSDLTRLPKDVLQDICVDLDIPESGSVNELASEIWGRVRGNKELQIRAFRSSKDKLLACKGSTTWYLFENSSEMTIK